MRAKHGSDDSIFPKVAAILKNDADNGLSFDSIKTAFQDDNLTICGEVLKPPLPFL